MLQNFQTLPTKSTISGSFDASMIQANFTIGLSVPMEYMQDKQILQFFLKKKVPT